jgi:hypothetical protein
VAGGSQQQGLTVRLRHQRSLVKLTQPIIAQQFDQDVLGDAGNLLSNFVQSGQIWALLVGFVLGYMLRSVTT